MSGQDERERAIAKEAIARGHYAGKLGLPVTDAGEGVITSVIAAVDAADPHPTSDAAAVRAEIVAELRARATIRRGHVRTASYDHEAHAASGAADALDEAADRIEATHPRPAEPASDLLRAGVVAHTFSTAAQPGQRLYTREEVLAYGEAVTSALIGPPRPPRPCYACRENEGPCACVSDGSGGKTEARTPRPDIAALLDAVKP